MTALGYLGTDFTTTETAFIHVRTIYSKQIYPYLSQSTIIRRAHISQGLTHPDAEIKSIRGNVPGIEKPSFKVILGVLKKKEKNCLSEFQSSNQITYHPHTER